MHWRHQTSKGRTEKLYSVHDHWRYADHYFDDYYVPDADVTLRIFGICSRSPDNHLIDRHHHFHNFHYVLSGKGYFNGVPFKSGDILYCNADFAYNLSSDRFDPCVYAWVGFTGGKTEKYLSQLGIGQPFRCYQAKNMQPIVEILYDMMEVDHEDLNVALYLESCLLRLLSLSVPPDPDAPAARSRKEKRVGVAIRYISDHFRDPSLHIGDIAAAISSNEKYLQRLFKSEMGMTIHQFISKLRMDAARNLLISSNYNINEISEFVGYNDRRTFSEAFKKHFGVSPTKFVLEDRD